MEKEEFRQSLIKAATPAETKLLQLINADSQLSGTVKFQHILSPYIVDFYFPSKKVAVELDGSSHISKKKYDDSRSEHIKTKYRVKVIRFSNSDVFNNPDLVIQKIRRYTYIKIKRNQSLRYFYGINPLAVPLKKKRARQASKTGAAMKRNTKQRSNAG